MQSSSWNALYVDEVYLAGERGPAGLYQEVGTDRQVRLGQDGILPASLDGLIPTYVCVRYTWEQATDHRTRHTGDRE